jgi:hypothetical protein
MLKTTQWSPDTCSCIFEYEWDTDAPPETRTHTLKRLVTACAAHAAGTEEEKFAAVIAENSVKNRGVAKVVEKIGRGLSVEAVNWSIDPQTREITLQTPANITEETLVRTDLGLISPKLKFQRR